MNDKNLSFIKIYKDTINVFTHKPARHHPNIAVGHITLTPPPTLKIGTDAINNASPFKRITRQEV